MKSLFRLGVCFVCALVVGWAVAWTGKTLLVRVIPPRAEAVAAVAEIQKPALENGDKLKTLVDTYFETGFKIGYSCGARGGSLGDAELLLSAYHRGDTNALIRWLETHP